jgi:RNA polymerase sigma factor (sigma-70 family)
MPTNQLRRDLEAALAGLDQARYGHLLPAVRTRVLENLRSGRAARVLDRRFDPPALASYVQKVADTLQAESGRLRALAGADDEAWQSLHQLLCNRAYQLLLGRGVSQAEASERAHDFAQETCLAIYQGRYPADVPYTAWARRVLTNIVYQVLYRRPDLLDDRQCARLTVDSDEAGGVPEPEDPDALAPRQPVEDRAVVERAIDSLPCASQREVLRLDLAGCSDVEIAARTGRSVQAVYNLRHRAVRTLRRACAPGTTSAGI